VIPVNDDHSQGDDHRKKNDQATPFAPKSRHEPVLQPLAFCMAASCSGVASVW
jgi:hypothetical protein